VVCVIVIEVLLLEDTNAYTGVKPNANAGTELAWIRTFVMRYVRDPVAGGSTGTPRNVMEFVPGPPEIPWKTLNLPGFLNVIPPSPATWQARPLVGDGQTSCCPGPGSSTSNSASSPAPIVEVLSVPPRDTEIFA